MVAVFKDDRERALEDSKEKINTNEGIKVGIHHPIQFFIANMFSMDVFVAWERCFHNINYLKNPPAPN